MNTRVNRSWRWTLGSAAAAAAVATLLSASAQAQVEEQVPLRQRPPIYSQPADAGRSEVKLYKVPAEQLSEIATGLQSEFAGRSEVHVGTDEQSSNVVVLAPSAAHEQVTAWLQANSAAAAATAPAGEAATTASAQASAGEPVQIGRATQPLKHISPRDVERELHGIWGQTAAFGASRGGETTTVRIPAGNHGEALLVVDHDRSLVTIDAPQVSLASWQKVIASLDTPRQSSTHQVGVIPFERADPLKIQRAIELIHAAAKTVPAAPSRAMRPSGASGRRQHIGQFASMIFQQGQPGGAQGAGGAQPGGQQPPAQPPVEGGQPQIEVQPGAGGEGTIEALQRIGNVRIEFVPGLDLLIITGNRRDVDMVKEIIRQIEEMSVQTQPEVEIYYLQHVDGQQIADTITAIYASAFPSQGTVTLTPLGKPNALLVIGRKEAIGPVLELIRRLDVPVAPQTQFRVFPLKFLPAVDAERTVRNFFTLRPGQGFVERTELGTRVMAIADFRSNSLIVRASPRDLEEVAALLEKIDVEGDAGRATNEVRVFKLQNSLADDLVLVIQEAVTGQIQGQQQQQQQQQQQGGQGQGFTPTPQASAQRETRLQMFSLDPERRELIESGILSDLRVSSDPRSNSLVVVGPASTMPLMAELIRQLDAPPGGEAQVKVYRIINGDATQLATMLQNIFGAATAQAGGAFGAAGFQSVTGTGESPLVPLRFAVDTRTNSIIATGSAGDLAVVRTILLNLDEAGIRQRELRVFRLKNTSAEAVAAALQQFLDQQQQLQTAQGQLVSALERLEEQVIVVADPVTNSLIISATSRYMPQVEKLIEDLDRRNPMVVIQLMIVEVTLDDINEFGVELGLQDSLLFQRGIPTPGFNFNNSPLGNVTTGVNTENTAGQGLTNFGVGRTSAAAGVGGLVLSASSESVSILIRALQASQRAQILSRPQIQTMDNQPAFVQVGARVPRIQGQTVTNNNVTQDVVDVNVGILLGVTPRVTPDGMVVMEIDAEKSEVGPDSTGIVVGTDSLGNPIISPQILTNLAQTTITARSGQTVILGGLISQTTGELTRRVPYLGDVPVLGRLFRFDSVSRERREVLFILTPYIMNSTEIEAQYNFRETERMSWCLADVVAIHGALPVGTAGANAFSHESPLIFPDETPAGPSIIRPGETLDPRLQPLPTPAVPPPGVPAPPPPAIPGPEIPPQSSRRPLPPEGQATVRLPSWQPAAAVPQQVQPAFRWEEQPPPVDPSAQRLPQPPMPQAPGPRSLTPATIAPAGYEQPLPAAYPVVGQSIYE